jgi:hypothetical protein
MSEATSHSDTHSGHEEHLEIWPDAGITETAKPVMWWLIVLYIGFAGGLCLSYWHQFVDHTQGFPKFGPGWLHISEEQQYPGKIDPVITTGASVTWIVGQETELALVAEGGRVGQVWNVVEDQGALPPGVSIMDVEAGVALKGTPTKAGEYRFTLRCDSGQGSAQKVIAITVNGADGQ